MTDSATLILTPVTSQFPAQALPAGLDFGDGRSAEQVLGSVYCTDYSLLAANGGIGFTASIIIAEELGIGIPGLDEAKLLIGAPPAGGITQVRLTAFVGEDGFELTADEIRVALRLPPSLLKPMPTTPGGAAPPFAEIAVHGAVSIDHHLDVRVRGFDRLSLPPVMVGDSGVVISADDVLLCLSKADTPAEILAAGFEEGFLGVYLSQATIKLPEGLPALAPDSLVIRNAAIGSQGVSGSLAANYGFTYDPAAKRFTGDGAGDLFGVPFGVTSLAIELRHNTLTAGTLTGQVLLPFFDHPVAVTVTIRADGSCAIDLGSGTGVGTIEHPGLLRLAVEHLGFEVAAGRLVAHLGGTVTPLIGGPSWPSFHADDIAIDADGNIAVHGAGLILANGRPLGLGPSPTGAGQTPGVTVDRLALSGNPFGDGLVADADVSAVASLGPVTASIQKLGVHTRLAVAADGSGPVTADLSFTPPTGIGLTVDAQGVLSGGGFLFHDADRHLFGGLMQLSVHEKIMVTAYGLISQRMPDGSPGFSLLIFVTADGFQPIPLGFGFMLQGIGGMLGVHRTFDVEVLRAGLKNDSLGLLLAPHDPAKNAVALVQALDSAFPARRGSILLGLLAHITWFSPTLVDLHLALILELGGRERLLFLGRVSALLPTKANDLIRLNLDVLGVLDFDAATLEADAVLVDSRLVHQFPVTGSAALRARWSGGGSFVLAVGGLNPRFPVPVGFPQLDRVTVALCSGSNPRLVCDGYFAITANTVQFGAHASLHAEAYGCTVDGDLGFDALVTLLPPHFIIDFHTGVQLKFHGNTLCKVALDGTLEGPLPLALAAKAKFEILWFSFSVDFHFTLAEGDVVKSLPGVSLVDEVAKALADPASWSTRAPTGVQHGVVLSKVPTGGRTALDPLGQLVVQQQVAPLNTSRDVDTYGGAAVSGLRRFELSGTLNGQPGTAITAAFAPARYFTMSDADKLAAPSFETMDAGLVLGSDVVSIDPGAIVAAPLDYDSIVLNPLPSAQGLVAAATGNYQLPAQSLDAQTGTGSAARAPVRASGRARFSNPQTAAAATLSAPSWRIVEVQTNQQAPIDPSITTWSEQRAALAVLNRGGQRWQMVAVHELPA
ncbi:hypothetical protein Rhe02_02920 [Rhizocola hellebori]|uniref:DUF6603 domain-containing protein n=1 Tax=Rhizocola hellebori TaxID=1392758 RepID=A0A8J3Q2R2_9ACTN|nr:DUF6603 domain-containing protein [Rhizocola hellebori]GIH02225.1 hypothetical protein Rhe02_02920 [Rhizocola hellebori]